MRFDMCIIFVSAADGLIIVDVQCIFASNVHSVPYAVVLEHEGFQRAHHSLKSYEI